LDLGQLAAVLSTAELVVSNSTGPLHLAAAVGSRVLGIYCPVEPCLPRRWGPYGPGHAWLMPDVPCCRKCTGSRCRHWDCMESLTVERAYDKAMEMLTDGGR
jgi:ADP-heptose:LPS heptosyltransferase